MRRMHYLFLLPLLLAACVPPRVDNRGHIGIEDKLKSVTPGTSTQQDVMDLLGSPSTKSNFGETAWYYVSARKESVAFLEPEIKDQHVTRILFDASGTVDSVKEYSLKDQQNIEITQEITPTEGQQLGVWEQLLGNFGRFNKAGGYDGPHSTINRAPGH